MNLPLRVFALAMIFTSARLAADGAPLISVVGRHAPAAGVEVEVSDVGGGLLNYRATFQQKRTAAPQVAAIRKDAPWFIYAESAAELWVWDGVGSLVRIQFTDAGIRFTDNHVAPDLLLAAPWAIRVHLPGGLDR